MDLQNCEFYSKKQCVGQLDGSAKDILNACTKDMVTVPCEGKYCQYKQLNEELDKFQLKYHVLLEETKNKGIVLESVDAKVKVENMKLRECLNEIKAIIKNFAKEDILTLPDLTKEQNYKFIAEQYAKPIKEIIKKISEVEK